MRFAKLLMFSVVFLFIVITLIGLLFPSTVVVSRATNVSSKKNKIDSLVLQPKNWQAWMPGTEGVAILENNINVVSKNSSTQKIIVQSVSKQQVKANWVGQKSTQQMELNIFESDMQTTIQWQFTEKIGWLPWQRFGSMLNEKILAPTMEQGLERLKVLVN